MEKELTTEELVASNQKMFEQMEARFNKLESELNDSNKLTKSVEWKTGWILDILSAGAVGAIFAAVVILLTR
ncbi:MULTISPECIES: hypothetical protein [Lactobacillus]|uniref:Uncharacterized protein n=1 Tax=Lactobacillus xujianguonis TaxID=2495899 RepID=A0A437SU80_9LACO|nr:MULTISPECIES: hypothetical protein [Lactobacillus]RVU70498.1 hypothetical protein EJK17_07345 [Lactobacillus xujianguonis]RVU76832.1 hypothetical protein EJK20_03360 [Lactobacillus xujianguonis]